MILVYVRIYQIAKKHTRYPPGVDPANVPNLAASRSDAVNQPQPPVEIRKQKKRSKRCKDNKEDSSSSGSDVEVIRGHDANGTSSNVGALEPGHQTSSPTQTYQNVIATSKGSQKAMIVREKRFTFVLAVVIGVFVVCWFPFFFTYILQAICQACKLPEALFKFFFWMGYCNSALNPLIYTIFNRDFRKAFKKILFKKCKGCCF
ncbi:hypothetical protein PO909_022922 [Leuciscus waleckii]